MTNPIPIDDPRAQAATRVINALSGLDLDVAQKIGILETVKHAMLREMLKAMWPTEK